MKSKHKPIVFLLTIISLTFGLGNINAIEVSNKKEQLQVYDIRSKEEAIVTHKNVFNLYEENNEKLTSLIKQREEENARLAKEEEEKKKKEEEEKAKEQEQYYYQTPAVFESSSDVANFAMQFVGNPYVAGGTSLTNGADCSGFVQAVYANFGVSLPRTTYEQAAVGSPVSMQDIMPGDIISYGYNGYSSHSALYVGNGMIVHASTPELGIRIDSMYIMPIVTIRRVG